MDERWLCLPTQPLINILHVWRMILIASPHENHNLELVRRFFGNYDNNHGRRRWRRWRRRPPHKWKFTIADFSIQYTFECYLQRRRMEAPETGCQLNCLVTFLCAWKVTMVNSSGNFWALFIGNHEENQQQIRFFQTKFISFTIVSWTLRTQMEHFQYAVELRIYVSHWSTINFRQVFDDGISFLFFHFKNVWMQHNKMIWR